MNRNNKKKRFKTYKRGQIIKIRYSPQVGYEMKDDHYSIVLNKNDSPYNGVLTVVPLSSKFHDLYIDIGDCLIASAVNTINKNFKDLTDMIKESTALMQSINDEMNIIDLCRKIEYITELNLKIDTDTSQFFELFDYYSKRSKKSYVAVCNIATLSKDRIIKPINEKDPILTMRVNSDILDKIDREIISEFTTCKTIDKK